METSQWITHARAAGWTVKRTRDGHLSLSCARHGCKGGMFLPIANLGPEPEPCPLQHHGQYAQDAYDLYIHLVEELKERRRDLGLSQEDVNYAAGFADGHINKLESFARTAQFKTLKLWTETLGLAITLVPSALPAELVGAVKGISNG